MLSKDLKAALSVALTESSLPGFELDATRGVAGATLAVLSLPADGGPMPAYPHVQLVFKSVTRLAVSLRNDGGTIAERR